MEAAGIDFLEYQFKPVLKFIESPTERLLIADEVGLGKTIEAALIWLELRARRDARRLLVVCPKMLARKWRSELREKFNISAEIGNFTQLKQSLVDFQREGNALRFAWICTYSGLRPSKTDIQHLQDADYKLSERGDFVRAISDLASDVSLFDLVICDEAHYMRNSASATSKLGTALSSAAAAMLLVSATPVNNTNRDLFTLLRLLDADFFENERLFQALLEENRPAVQTLNALSSIPPRIEEARSHAAALTASSFVGKSELLIRLRTALSALDGNHNLGLVAAQEMAERLNILGSYVTRTRRAQVKEKQPKRDPHVVIVDLTPTEEKFYAAITQMVRGKVAKAGKTFSAFHLVMPQQRMASCIPAMVQAYRSGQLGDFQEVFSESFDLNEDDLDHIDGSDSAPQDLTRLLTQFQGYDFEANDSKYEKLRSQLLHPLAGQKVIIFSYFKGTLFYLQRRLIADGIPCALIHGDILDQDTRDAEIERFRDLTDVRVLLSSEVGSEGIDLQFCHVLVNYDLPWNPMRIEQRIGRIDRVGQQADRLIIVHFKILRTIEERLYTRLHEKLFRFQNSIGDLEPIIGKEIQELTLDLLKQELTPEEEEERIAKTEFVLNRRVEETRRLEESGESLLAHADYIAAKVDQNRDLGRYVTGEDLRQYVDDFFTHNFPGCRIQWDYPITDAFRLELTFKAHDSLTDYLHAQKLETPSEMQARIIVGTLLPELAKKRRVVNQRRLVLINHLSPLVRWITHENQQREGAFYDVSALQFRHDSLPPGIYAYRVERWRLVGLRTREVLAYGVALLGREPLDPHDAEQAIHEVITHAETWRHADYPPDSVLKTHGRLRDSLQDRFEAMHSDFGIRNETLASIQRAQIENHFKRRRELDERRLATLRARGRSDKAIKLVESHLLRDEELSAKRERDLRRKTDISFNFQEVAGGIFRVEKP